MKTVLSALVALSFLAAAAAPSHATSTSEVSKSIKKLDKEGRGGHPT